MSEKVKLIPLTEFWESKIRLSTKCWMDVIDWEHFKLLVNEVRVNQCEVAAGICDDRADMYKNTPTALMSAFDVAQGYHKTAKAIREGK